MKKSISNRQIQNMIQKWQTLLNLDHWRIQVSEKKPSKNHLLEISINRNRSLASIRVSLKARGKNRKEFETLLLHELIHVVIDPIQEEYDFQTKTKNEENRFTRAVEKVVEHLAYVTQEVYSKNRPS